MGAVRETGSRAASMLAVASTQVALPRPASVDRTVGEEMPSPQVEGPSTITAPSATPFAPGQRGGIFTVSMSAPARMASGAVVNWSARSRTRHGSLSDGGGEAIRPRR